LQPELFDVRFGLSYDNLDRLGDTGGAAILSDKFSERASCVVRFGANILGTHGLA
jgi:hypothetical protein